MLTAKLFYVNAGLFMMKSVPGKGRTAEMCLQYLFIFPAEVIGDVVIGNDADGIDG